MFSVTKWYSEILALCFCGPTPHHSPQLLRELNKQRRAAEAHAQALQTRLRGVQSWCLQLGVDLAFTEVAERKLTVEEEEAKRIAEMGKPILGEHPKLEVIIEESYEFKVSSCPRGPPGGESCGALKSSHGEQDQGGRGWPRVQGKGCWKRKRSMQCNKVWGKPTRNARGCSCWSAEVKGGRQGSPEPCWKQMKPVCRRGQEQSCL